MSTLNTHRKVPGLPGTIMTAVQTFESLAAMCETRLAYTGPSLPSGNSMEGCGGPEWYGSADMREAIHMLRHGAPHATATVRAYVQQATGTGERPTWEPAVAGQRVDVAAWIAGDPECMLAKDAEHERMPRLRLVASSNVLASYNKDDVLRYAGAVACVIEALQAAGYDLAFTACEFTKGDTTHHATPVSVLEFGQPVDISKVAFAMHPSMQRRVQFAVRELDPGYELRLRQDGKGHTAKLTPDAAALLFPQTDDTLTVCLPCATEAIDACKRHGAGMLQAMVALCTKRVDEALATVQS